MKLKIEENYASQLAQHLKGHVIHWFLQGVLLDLIIQDTAKPSTSFTVIVKYSDLRMILYLIILNVSSLWSPTLNVIDNKFILVWQIPYSLVSHKIPNVLLERCRFNTNINESSFSGNSIFCTN